jgi:hypothetical protein
MVLRILDRRLLRHPTPNFPLTPPAPGRKASAMDKITAALRANRIVRAAMRHCALAGWAPVAQMPLPDSRRPDIIALTDDGSFVAIEVKSTVEDYLSDEKWQEYRDWCDQLYFAVDLDFPHEVLPEDVGLLVTDRLEVEVVREAPYVRLSPARRRAILHRFAVLAAGRLAALQDPEAAREVNAALKLE